MKEEIKYRLSKIENDYMDLYYCFPGMRNELNTIVLLTSLTYAMSTVPLT